MYELVIVLAGHVGHRIVVGIVVGIVVSCGIVVSVVWYRGAASTRVE